MEVTFALSIWHLSSLDKQNILTGVKSRIPLSHREKFINTIHEIFNPKITSVSTYGRKEGVEIMHVEVMGDRRFLLIPWSEFYDISYKYKNDGLFPVPELWKSWHDRLCAERWLSEKREIDLDKHLIFHNETQYNNKIQEIYRNIQKTEYGSIKLQKMVQKEIIDVVCKKIEMQDLAAFKIQQAFRRKVCRQCKHIFYHGIGPVCSRECANLDVQ